MKKTEIGILGRSAPTSETQTGSPCCNSEIGDPACCADRRADGADPCCPQPADGSPCCNK